MTLYDRVWAFKQRSPFLGTIAIMPWRTAQACSDPQRRRQLLGQFILCAVAALPWAGWWAPASAVLNFLLYEFVGEVFFRRWFGAYWERSRPDGTPHEQ